MLLIELRQFFDESSLANIIVPQDFNLVCVELFLFFKPWGALNLGFELINFEIFFFVLLIIKKRIEVDI